MRLVFAEQGIFFVRATRRDEPDLNAFRQCFLIWLFRIGFYAAILVKDQSEPLFQIPRMVGCPFTFPFGRLGIRR